MLCGYFLTDVMSPLKPMLEKELLWDSLDYGFFTSAYGWFNVFLLMLISVSYAHLYVYKRQTVTLPSACILR